MNIYLSAYLDKNLGDDLMIRLLVHSFPEHRFYLYCPDPLYFPDLGAYPNLQPTSLPVRELGRAKEPRFDTYLRIGGSIFGMRGRRTPFIRYQNALRIGRMARKGLKSAIIGCNVNRFSSSLARRTAQKEFKTIGLATVRDEASFAFARPLKNESRLFLCPDMLFSLPDSFYSSTAEKDGPLGVSVYHSKYLTEENKTYCRTMADFCDRYGEQTGKEIHLLAFDSGRENDRLAAEEILSQMKRREVCKIIAHRGDGSEMLNAISRCGAIVGTRFHAIVLALRLGVPFIPISYSEKTENLLRDIEYRGPQFDFFPMDNPHTTERLLQAVLSPEYTVGADPAQLMKEAGGHMQRLREYLDSSAE